MESPATPPAHAEISIDRLPSRALFESRPPPELFHYTDLDGVAGILGSRFLWLSKISTLNDTSEINLAVHHFKVLAHEAAQGLPPGEAAMLALAVEQVESFRRTNICVGSFCEEQDHLNQWRSYGNDGRGIALGFNTRELSRIAGEHDVRLVRCIYDPQAHLRITRELATLLLETYRAGDPGDDVRRKSLLDQFNTTFLMTAPVIKDPHFGEEHEWRLVSMPRSVDDELLTAVLTGNVASVRFVMPLCPDDHRPSEVISSVVIGPTLDPANVADAVDVLARRQGFKVPDIRYSRIPYRPNR